MEREQKEFSFFWFSRLTPEFSRTLIPRSQNSRLQKESLWGVSEKKIEFFTSDFGVALSEDKLSKKVNFESITRWAKYQRIQEKYHPLIYASLKKRSRNPHKNWTLRLFEKVCVFLEKEISL